MVAEIGGRESIEGLEDKVEETFQKEDQREICKREK